MERGESVLTVLPEQLGLELKLLDNLVIDSAEKPWKISQGCQYKRKHNTRGASGRPEAVAQAELQKPRGVRHLNSAGAATVSDAVDTLVHQNVDLNTSVFFSPGFGVVGRHGRRFTHRSWCYNVTKRHVAFL